MPTLNVNFKSRPVSAVRLKYVGGYPNAKSFITQIGGGNDGNRVYKFPYSPVVVDFNDLSNEFEQVDRPGNFPLIFNKAKKLMRVSFQFRIAHRPTNGLRSIEHDLKILREIASGDLPVAIVGMGNFGHGKNPRKKMFRVTEFSVKIVRRGPQNEPWQADCNITLIEDRNPEFNFDELFPVIYFPEPPRTVGSTPGNGNGGSGSGNGDNPAPPNDEPVDNWTDVSP